MSDFVWEEPQSHGRGFDWVAHLAPLRERPGEWARVWGPDPKSTALAQYVKRGDAAGVTRGEYETKCRTIDGGLYMYARYVGPVA